MKFRPKLPSLKATLSSLGFAATLLGLLAFSVYSPQLHNLYIRNKVGSVVVKITNVQGTSGGTGFHVKAASGKTYILTNNHVCEIELRSNLITIESPITGRKIQRQIVERFKKHDLCLIEGVPEVEGISVGSEQSPGDLVFTTGHPRLVPLTVSKGEVIQEREIELVHSFNTTEKECPGRFIDLSDNFGAAMFGLENVCLIDRISKEFTASIYPGSSGSPVVNTYGNLVGVVFAGSSRVPTENFYVPLRFVEELLSIY